MIIKLEDYIGDIMNNEFSTNLPSELTEYWDELFDINDEKQLSAGSNGSLRANEFLTKREMFAISALQGILSNSKYGCQTYSSKVKSAANYADALLLELELGNES